MKTLISSRSVLYLVLLIGSITFFVPGIASSAEPSTDVVKATSPKKNQKSYKFTGGLSVAASTDRNAGIAPIADSAQGDFATDDDEDSDGDESFAAPDAFEDLDLDDQDAVDQLDETIDEDGDGDFFDEDGAGDDEEGDLDGDGIDDTSEIQGDDDGDGIVDEIDLVDDSGFGSGASGARRQGATRAARSRRDERFSYTANLGYTQKIGGLIKEWKTAAKVVSTDFDRLSKNDTILFGGTSGPVFKVKSLKAQFQPAFVFAHLRKDGVDIFDNYGVGLSSQFKLSKQWKLGARYGYDIRKFDNPRVKDIDAHSFGTQLQYALGKKHAVSFGYTNRFEDTDFAALARTKNQHQVALIYQKKWQNGVYIKPQIGYAMSEKDAAVRPNQPIREDDRTSFGLAIGAAMNHGVSTEIQFGSTSTDVNLDGKDSSNDRIVVVANLKL